MTLLNSWSLGSLSSGIAEDFRQWKSEFTQALFPVLRGEKALSEVREVQRHQCSCGQVNQLGNGDMSCCQNKNGSMEKRQPSDLEEVCCHGNVDDIMMIVLLLFLVYRFCMNQQVRRRRRRGRRRIAKVE